MNRYALVIFDIDGTLCLLDETDLLPNRKEILDELASNQVHLAIATNQGGVGYRLYRQTKNKSTDEFPTESDVLDRIEKIKENIDWPIRVNVAFSYYLKWERAWSPVPDGRDHEPFWHPDFRKPSGGMLLDHIKFFGVAADATLYIGDRPEDEAAARAAGCHFEWAWKYFGDPEPIDESENEKTG
ncbi:MAG: HAD-IIIA family hydrolase [Chloroflexota bacterium]